jgi:hypothetical protein
LRGTSSAWFSVISNVKGKTSEGALDDKCKVSTGRTQKKTGEEKLAHSNISPINNLKRRKAGSI